MAGMFRHPIDGAARPQALRARYFHVLSRALSPSLEIVLPGGARRRLPLARAGEGRRPGEALWVARLDRLPEGEDWRFRVNLGKQTYDAPGQDQYYSTHLHSLWLQDHQIFNYQPAATVSPSRVMKIERFTGSLSPRALYLYLPRGYDEHQHLHYPVIYMHDGQNCFQAYAQDSYAGSWQADRAADQLIRRGKMQECIIVGVSNGQKKRIAEYLPPYITLLPPRPQKPTPRQSKLETCSTFTAADPKSPAPKSKEPPARPLAGRADKTFAYYRDVVAPYVAQHTRALPGREHTATIGSSMGGLFSTYIAWEYPEFARHHAILSPSFWVTRSQEGAMEIIEHLRTGEPRDLRLWLDSGTLDAPGRGDDDLRETQEARDALLENGYVLGPNFQYFLDENGAHDESSWARRLPKIFQFLFPLEP